LLTGEFEVRYEQDSVLVAQRVAPPAEPAPPPKTKCP
jgi:hypothetical protein